MQATNPARESLQVHHPVSEGDQRPQWYHCKRQCCGSDTRQQLRTPELGLHVRERWPIVQYRKALQSQLATKKAKSVRTGVCGTEVPSGLEELR